MVPLLRLRYLPTTTRLIDGEIGRICQTSDGSQLARPNVVTACAVFVSGHLAQKVVIDGLMGSARKGVSRLRDL